MDIRSGRRGRSSSTISGNDVLSAGSLNDQYGASYQGSSAIGPSHSAAVTKWDSIPSSSNVKTPARSFYHRAFHGSLGPCFTLHFDFHKPFTPADMDRQIPRSTHLRVSEHRLQNLLHLPSQTERLTYHLRLLHLSSNQFRPVWIFFDKEVEGTALAMELMKLPRGQIQLTFRHLLGPASRQHPLRHMDRPLV